MARPLGRFKYFIFLIILDPIENLFWILKSRLSKAPYIKDMEEFREFIRQEWADIEPRICENLVSSMPKRIRSVIERAGQPTKY